MPNLTQAARDSAMTHYFRTLRMMAGDDPTSLFDGRAVVANEDDTDLGPGFWQCLSSGLMAVTSTIFICSGQDASAIKGRLGISTT